MVDVRVEFCPQTALDKKKDKLFTLPLYAPCKLFPYDGICTLSDMEMVETEVFHEILEGYIYLISVHVWIDWLVDSVD